MRFKTSAVIALIAGSTVARADLVVRVEYNGTVVQDFAPGAPINLAPADSVDLINIYGFDTTAGTLAPGVSIGPVAVADAGTLGDAVLDFLVADGPFPTNAQLPFVDLACTNFSGLTLAETLRPTARLAGAIAGNLTGPLTVGSIFRLQVAGDVQSPVTATAASGAFAIDRLIVGGSITAGATIEATSGNINIIQTGVLNPAGAIHAPVLAEQGRIVTIDAAGPISIADTRGIRVKESLTVVKGASVSANITAGTNGGQGRLARIEATAGALSANVTANLVVRDPAVDPTPGGTGFITPGDFSGNWTINGSCQAYFEIGGGMLPGSSVYIQGEYGGYFLCNGDIERLEIGGSLGMLGPSGVECRQGSIRHLWLNKHDETGLVFAPIAARGVIEDFRCQFFAGQFLGFNAQGAIEPARLGNILIESDSVGTVPIQAEQVGEFRVGGTLDQPLILTRHPAGSLVHAGNAIVNTIQILEPASLGGLILAGGYIAGQPGGYISGPVSIGTPPTTLGPLPAYTQGSCDLGGGSIGVVPYQIHFSSCASNPPVNPPAANDLDTPPSGTVSIVQSAFSTYYPTGVSGGPVTPKKGISLEFYGPVFTTFDQPALPVSIEYSPNPNDPTPTWVPYDNQCYAVLDRHPYSTPVARPRRLTVYAYNVYGPGNLLRMLPAGTYRVRSKNIATQPEALRCGGLSPFVAEANAPAVAPFEYRFTLLRDCEGDGQPDANCQTNTQGGCIADVDDGSGSGTPDGGVTVDDLVYYLGLYQIGDIDADVDDGTFSGTRDEGVTIDDFIFFIAHYEAGC